ncbi:hypothetical protein D3C72_2371550 [compost metagenome]
MYLGAECACLLQVAEGKLAGVDAYPFRLVHGAGSFLVVDVLALDGVSVDDACVVVEHVAQDLGFFL